MFKADEVLLFNSVHLVLIQVKKRVVDVISHLLWLEKERSTAYLLRASPV